jgi:diguanylate cyclase (GGDEF)-like protein
VLKVVFFDMQLALDTYFHSDRKELWRLATHDVLTGLPNRRLFHERLMQEIDNASRNKQHFALLLVDLDGFKEVNDALGHAIGDRLLIEAARRVREVAGGHNTVARVGGDEFMIILPFMPDPSIAEGIAERIIAKLTIPYLLDTEITYLSASAGIALYPQDADSVGGLVTSADQAMHESKRKGKGRWCRFAREFQEMAQYRIRLAHDLRGALADQQFRVYYQPIVDLASGHIYKAEALVRWCHPERGMVSPTEFIPIAETTGLIHEIGDWVFKESARWARRWTEIYSANFKISVNESPVQFMDRQISINVSPAQFETESLTFAENWLNHLKELGLSGENVVVEITEGLLLHADPDILDKLLKLRDAGIQVAIDDFGTGYSSLSYLRKFDIDYLKIDQTFVRDLATSVNDQTLCQAIIVMAHTLGLKVIAEGVETETQRDILMAAGCDYAQGYYYARPMPPEEFERLFTQPFPS